MLLLVCTTTIYKYERKSRNQSNIYVNLNRTLLPKKKIKIHQTILPKYNGYPPENESVLKIRFCMYPQCHNNLSSFAIRRQMKVSLSFDIFCFFVFFWWGKMKFHRQTIVLELSRKFKCELFTKIGNIFCQLL